jgi:hypothetical protein
MRTMRGAGDGERLRVATFRVECHALVEWKVHEQAGGPQVEEAPSLLKHHTD